MASIINCGYVQPRSEIWNLFLPGLSRPCIAANRLLAALICQGLPENYEPSIVGSSASSANSQGKLSNVKMSQTRPLYPLRRCLIRWLMSFLDIDDGACLSDSFRRTNLSPRTVAEILYALTVQNLAPVLREKYLLRATNLRIHSQHSLEAVYLDNLFEVLNQAHNTSKRSVAFASDKTSGAKPLNHSPHIASVLEYLKKYLHQVSRNLESLEPGVIIWFT